MIEWAPLTITLMLAIALVQLLVWAKNSLMFFINQRQYRNTNLNKLQSQLVNITSARLEKPKPTLAWAGWRKFIIKKISDDSADIRSFYLRPHDGKELSKFKPGQYLTVSLKYESQVSRLIRCYSLSDSYHKDQFRISVKRIPAPQDQPELPEGLASNFMHDLLKEGDVIDVKAPRGNFCPDMKSHTSLVLIGGGIGIAPILSIVNSIIDSNSELDVWLFYCARDSSELIYRQHLQHIAKHHNNIHIHICYSNEKLPQQEQNIVVHHQRISLNLLKQALHHTVYAFGLCGPSSMLNELMTGLKEWGVDEQNIHVEAFSGDAVKSKITTKPTPDPANNDASSKFFEVTFAQSDKTVLWYRDSGSILELAKDNDIALDYGCGAGSCGTCAIPLISGTLNYLVNPNYDIDESICYSCLAQPNSNLVLDA